MYAAALWSSCFSREMSASRACNCGMVPAARALKTIDAAGKLIIFSDGLDVPLVDELEQYFRGRIQTTFGIGTNLTNDLGFAPLSMVVKVATANGLPVAKLSDNIAKASGDPNEIDRMKLLTGYASTFSEPCRY